MVMPMDSSLRRPDFFVDVAWDIIDLRLERVGELRDMLGG